MVKGGRSYIPLSRDNNGYKLYVADIKTWHQISKKKTPRLPAYSEVPSIKWEELTETEF